MKYSVLYIVNVPASYRVAFFNELGLSCKLTVIFERYRANDREDSWHDYNFKNFEAKIMDGINIGNDSSFNLKILNELSKPDDIVVVGNYSTPTGILAINYLKLKSRPFLISVDGGIIASDENIIKKRLKTNLISSASAWLSTGDFTNKYLEYYGANRENIYTYPFTTVYEKNLKEHTLTVDEKREIRKKLNIPYKHVIVSVGSFIYRKGFDVLINAAGYFPENTGVYIIGGKVTEEYKKLLSATKQNNIHFLEYLEHDLLNKYYSSADLFAFPTRQDVWGLAVNEAMANGLPVITTTSCVAGLEMIENEKNGILIPKDNVELLAKSINNVLNNSKLKEQMSMESLKTAKRYTIENI